MRTIYNQSGQPQTYQKKQSNFTHPSFANQPVKSQNYPQQTYQQQNNPTYLEKQKYQQQQQTPQNSNQESIKYYLISVGLFLAAFLVFVIVWGVEKFAINHQVSSHYYQKKYNWISAHTGLFQIKVLKTAKGVAMALIFEWLMWKLPLIYFTYNCIKLRQGAIKWITLGVMTFILLTVDILLHIFLLQIYNSYMYFGLYSILTVTVAAINNKTLDRTKQAILDSFLPLSYIAVVHIIQVICLPILQKIYTNNLDSSTALFLIFYLFPIFDLIMYAFLIFVGKYISKQVKIFHQQLHFLTIGYSIGMIMLIGYTQVQFYYLLTYYIFRNVFCNWVMYKWDSTLNLPAALPCWILPYYFSYVLLFIPFSGVGNVITSIGYYSFLLVNTTPSLYAYPNTLYAYSTFSTASWTDLLLNTSFNGSIYWIAGIVIWVGMTFSQRYSLKKPEIPQTLIYNIFGIYLFYLGLCSGLSGVSLVSNSLISS